ncbi:MAG: hypothetical protein RL186_163 [Pseudomonadota bacterium]|jgi:hypothetical protein
MHNLRLSKTRFKLSFGQFSAILGAACAMAGQAQAVESIIPVGAVIVAPIAVSQPAEMRFGSVIAGATAGTVILDLPLFNSATQPTTANPTTVGTRTVSGGATLVGGATCSATVLCGVGSVQVGGLASGTFTKVTMPASVTLTSGVNSMTVNTLKTRYGAPGTAGVESGAGSFDATGRATVIFAGTLNVGASQPAGNYSGSMTVDIDY